MTQDHHDARQRQFGSYWVQVWFVFEGVDGMGDGMIWSLEVDGIGALCTYRCTIFLAKFGRDGSLASFSVHKFE